MKAVLCKRLDGPEALEIAEIEAPTPGPAEVVVAVKAAALNFFDTLITRGKYQFKPELPFSPSGEIAGDVLSIGPDVASGLAVGDRVMAHVGWGGAREQVVVAANQLLKVPDGVSYAVASGVSITYGTAIHGLRDRGALKAGETIAVLGASGGAGLAAIEIAKRMGARVIASASTPEKREITLANGADIAIDTNAETFKETLRAHTDGRGVDIVYDCVGGDLAEPALRALTWGGRYLVIGFASGDIPKFPANLLLLKGVAVMGVFWGEAARRHPAQHAENMSDVLKWVETGDLTPRIHDVFPLQDIGNALGILDRREAIGKIVLEISG